MSRCHPFAGGVFSKKRFIEDDLFVFPAEFAKSRFEFVARGPKVTRHTSDAIDMAVGSNLLGGQADDRPCAGKEILHYLGDQATLFGLGRFADNDREVQFAFCQAFQRGIGDAAEAAGVDFGDDASCNCLFGLVMEIHIANHFFELIGRK